jgi:hypothetical protein
MPHFTVIGYYPDNDQPWAANAEAESWEAAIRACTKDVAEGFSVRVCAVLEGNHMCVDEMDETLEISNPGEDLVEADDE